MIRRTHRQVVIIVVRASGVGVSAEHGVGLVVSREGVRH